MLRRRFCFAHSALVLAAAAAAAIPGLSQAQTLDGNTERPARARFTTGHVIALPRPSSAAPSRLLTREEALDALSGAALSRLYGNPNAVSMPTRDRGLDLERSIRPVTLHPGVGPNVVVNNEANDVFTPPALRAFTQSETSIEAFGQNVVVGYNDAAGPTSFSGYSFSADGGRTFTQGAMLFSGLAPSGDPSIAVDDVGLFYYAFLDQQNVAGQRQSALTIAVSTNGGQTFPTGTTFAAGNNCDFLDKEHIAVLRSSAAVNGPRIVMSYTRFVNSDPFNTMACLPGVTAQVEVVVINPVTGALVQGPVVVSTGADNSGSVPRVDTQGRIFVAWEDRANARINVVRSDNGGASYVGLGAVPTLVSNVTRIGTLQLCGANMRRVLNGGFRVNDFPTMDIDLSGGVGNDNVYIAWNDARNGDPDILLSRSTDGGLNWSATPQRVNDDGPPGNGIDQFFPWVTVDPNGHVGVIYMDRRLDPVNNMLIDLFHTDSQNQGLGFQSSVRVSDVSHLPVVNVDPNIAACYMSDYNYAASDANHIYASWSDNRDGDPDAFFARIHAAQQLLVNAPLDFGVVCVGESQVRMLEVFNTGAQPLTVTSVARISGSTAITIGPNPTLPVVIAPGGHVDFSVICTPTAFGAQTATIRITSTDTSRPNFDVTATFNTPPGDIHVTGSTNLGEVCRGTFGEGTISICNLAACNLSVTSASFSPACTGFEVVNTPFPAVLGPGACVGLTFRFTPSTVGSFACDLVITSNDPDQPTITLAVTAVVPEPICSITGIGTTTDPEGELVAIEGTAVRLCGPPGDFRYEWTFDDEETIAFTQCIDLNPVDDDHEGTYTLLVTDECKQQAVCQKELEVDDVDLYASTPSGSDVAVPLAPAATVSFKQVMSSGTTYLRYQAVPDLPAGWVRMGAQHLNIGSTASYSGGVGITIEYGPQLQHVAADLRVLKYDLNAGAWLDITTGIDVANHIIMGACDVLSTFALAVPEAALVAVEPEEHVEFGLRAAYPNPSSGRTTIRFGLTRSGPVRLTVHDVQGRSIATLVSGVRQPGTHTVPWTGRAFDGHRLPAGLYMLRLESIEGLQSRKLVLTD